MSYNISQIQSMAQQYGLPGISNQQAQDIMNNNGGGNEQQIDSYFQQQQQTQQQQQAAQTAQQNYATQTQNAISGLQTGKADLAGQYGTLLQSINGPQGVYQPLINQATLQQNAQNASRGLVSNVGNGGTQMISALNPVYSAEAGAVGSVTAGSITDVNTYNNAIANMQSGAAGTSAQLPLQFGSLALAQQEMPSTIAYNTGMASQAANANATALAEAQLKAATPFQAGAGIVFSPSSSTFTQSGGGASPDMMAMAKKMVSLQKTKRQNASTISQYVQ